MTSNSPRVHNCRHCQRFVVRHEHFTAQKWNIELPHTAADILQAHKDGCALFSDSSFADWHPTWTLRLHVDNNDRWQDVDGSSWEMFKRYSDGNEIFLQSLRMRPWRGAAADELCGQVAISLDPYVSSENSFQWARKWLSTCHTTHTLCAYSLDNFVPTRLLKILRSHNDTMVCLIETPPKHVKWAALSYVWGGNLQACMSLFPTLEELRSHSSVHKLPQTVNDAIRVCVGLEVDYLWIDILCILQEDKEDKKRELAMMPKIYQRAWVTISASTAKHVSEGFLEDRAFSTSDERVISLPYVSADGQRGGFMIAAISAKFADPGIYDKSEPIHGRAWTYQERRLSPRLLDFSRWNLMCICRTGAFFEEHGLIDWSSPPAEWHWNLPANLRQFNNSVPCLENQHLPAWHSVVREYASRKLTLPTDKLIAIGALAQIYKEKHEYRYIAGLWEETLVDDICWVVFPECEPLDGTLLPRPHEYRAPSWSWAAIDVHERRTIHFVNGQAESHRMLGPPCAQTELVTKAKIVRVAVEQDPPNSTFGQIRTGHLVIEGLTIDTLWNPKDLAYPFPFRYYYPRIFRDALEHEAPTLGYNSHIAVSVRLLVVKIGLREVPNSRCCHIFGLILLPVSSGRYRRAGAFEFLDPQPEDGTVHKIRDEPPVQFVRRVVEIV